MSITGNKMKNHYLLQLLIAVCAVLLPVSALADSPVRGKVTDKNGEPLAGTMVYEQGTSNGTMTDVDGQYSFTVSSDDAVLTFSTLGFKEYSVSLAGRAVVNVTLEEDTETLDEVVIVGYGVQKRGTLTGSVASINTEKLTSAPTDNLTNMLGGKLPGLV